MVSNLLIESTIAFGAVVAIFLYAAFWGSNIRNSLAVRLYRNQALSTVLVAGAFAIFAIVAGVIVTISESANAGVVTISESANAGLVTQVVAYVLVISSIMYFVDSSVLSSRRLDPLVRDVFHWTRLRYVLWPLMAVLAVASLALGAVVPNPPLALALFGITPALVPSVSGIAALWVSRSRTADLTFRRHLTWFALFGGSFVLFVIILGVTPSFDISSGLDFWQSVEYFAPFPPAFVAGYCLYRAARSLAPLNKLLLSES
jgi:hypothetical protein